MAAREKKILDLTNVYKVIEKEKFVALSELNSVDELMVLLNNLVSFKF